MTANHFKIHPQARIEAVRLKVSTLHRAMQFYGDVLGLQTLGEREHQLQLGVEPGAPLIVLDEVPGAQRKPARTAGLYHYAILVPSRVDLARVVMRFIETQYPLQGASDHGVSEALYLADPDGNGIEIYVDRPRDAWPHADGELSMTTDPLDMEGLLSLLGEDKHGAGLPPGTRMGHIHLHVSRLAEAEAFYRDQLGLDLIQHYGGSAAFLSAGGYHHHVGINTWAGVGAPPPPADAVGLRYFTLQVPDQAELQRLIDHLAAGGIATAPQDGGVVVSDPSGNEIVLAAGSD